MLIFAAALEATLPRRRTRGHRRLRRHPRGRRGTPASGRTHAGRGRPPASGRAHARGRRQPGARRRGHRARGEPRPGRSGGHRGPPSHRRGRHRCHGVRAGRAGGQRRHGRARGRDGGRHVAGRPAHHVGRGRHRGHASHRGQRSGRGVGEQLMRPVSLGQRVLGRQQPLRCRPVPLALGVFLERVRDGDGSVAQILACNKNKSVHNTETTGLIFIPFIASIAASEASKLA